MFTNIGAECLCLACTEHLVLHGTDPCLSVYV